MRRARVKQKSMAAKGYNNIEVLKNNKLGVGSYGAVYKAKCDQLTCAAKMLHPILFDESPEGQVLTQKNQHRLPMKRFEQECQFLSIIRHPNIIQYLGVHRDKDTGYPVLLMELMDTSLTVLLEEASQTTHLSFHVAVNISMDVALALSFLHSNGIIHRDLSSNNILMLGTRRAKVTDFGMARLFNSNGGSMTEVPGTDVYMPPECTKENQGLFYTSKLDCFSFGVIVVQILCCKFPDPSRRMEEVQRQGEILHRKIKEVERRRKHIILVIPGHPLLPTALACLRDEENDRPTSTDLVDMLEDLKSSRPYVQSKESDGVRGGLSYKDQDSRGPGKQSNEEVVLQLVHSVEVKDAQISRLEASLQQKTQELQSFALRMDAVVAGRNEEVHHYRERMDDLERMLARAHDSIPAASRELTLTSSESIRAPRAMYRMCNAVLDGDTLYFAVIGNIDSSIFYAFSLQAGKWAQLPDIGGQKEWCVNTIAMVSGSLTTVGGTDEDELVTNQLFSLVEQGGDKQWEEIFPPMTVRRDYSMAFCHEFYLVVAGGNGNNDSRLRSVEVLDTHTKQWSLAEPLPEPLSTASVALCNDRVYFAGGWFSEDTPTSSVHMCRLADLVRSSVSQERESVWSRIADLPVLKSTCITYQGHLITVGGVDVMNRATTAVYRYDTSSNSWMMIGHLLVPRAQAFATYLPHYNVVLVIGGHRGYYINKIYEGEEVTLQEISKR